MRIEIIVPGHEKKKIISMGYAHIGEKLYLCLKKNTFQ